MNGTPHDFGLREDTEGWYCSCSVRLWPDCDVSAVSVSDEFQRHLRDHHGFSQNDIEESLAFTSRRRYSVDALAELYRADLTPQQGLATMNEFVLDEQFTSIKRGDDA